MATTPPAKRAPRTAAGTGPATAKTSGAAPRRAASRKTASATAAPKVVLDLDNLSKQKAFPGLKLPSVPYTFLLNGVTYELRDPRDSDWKMALELASNPFRLMRVALVGADDPVDNPTDFETELCRERLGLPPKAPAAGTPEAEQEAKDFPDGIRPAVIDRFTASELPTWKLNALFANWHEYFKIDVTSGKGLLKALLGQSDE